MILTAWLLWIVPLGAVPLVGLLGRADPRLRGWVAVVATGLSLALSALGALEFSSPAVEGIAGWLPGLSVPVEVQVDGLSVLVSVFVSFVSFLVAVYSLGYMKAEAGLTRYYSLVLLFVGSMLGLVMAGNLIQFYFFWEVVGVCSALLISFWSSRDAARKAGLKAFVVTRVGDASLLVGVLLITTTLGTSSFAAVASPWATATLGGFSTFLVGLLVVIGAMGKSAQVPLHVWLPDAMEGPTPVSALIHAATMVNAGVFLLLRMFPLLESSSSVLNFVTLVGLASALLGGACAFTSSDIKRVLAYSTISQLGLMFAAVGMGSTTLAAYQMVGQGLFKALAFLSAGWVAMALGTRDIDSMGGLRHRMRYTYAGFAISMLAMSGLPPLVGFWSKDAILSLSFSSGWIQAASVVLSSAITALYSFRVLLRVFHGSPGSSQRSGDSPPSMLVPMVILAASLLVGWVPLGLQTLVYFGPLAVPDLAALTVSLVVLAASSAAAYLFSLRKRDAFLSLVASNRPLSGAREFLVSGLGFDALYSAAFGKALPWLTRASLRLQTGLVEANTSLLLLVLTILFLLFAFGAV